MDIANDINVSMNMSSLRVLAVKCADSSFVDVIMILQLGKKLVQIVLQRNLQVSHCANTVVVHFIQKARQSIV